MLNLHRGEGGGTSPMLIGPLLPPLHVCGRRHPVNQETRSRFTDGEARPEGGRPSPSRRSASPGNALERSGIY